MRPDLAGHDGRELVTDECLLSYCCDVIGTNGNASSLMNPATEGLMRNAALLTAVSVALMPLSAARFAVLRCCAVLLDMAGFSI